MTADRAGRPQARVRGWKPPRPPANKGKRYEPDPPSGAEILRALDALGDGIQDRRLSALVVVLWRAGLTAGEALRLKQEDCDAGKGAIVVKAARKAARRRAAMDAWGFECLARWEEVRRELPAGPVFCVLRGPTAGQSWGHAGVQAELRRLSRHTGVNLTARQLRYAHAVELLTQGIPITEAYRQLGLSTARNNRASALLSPALTIKGQTASQALKPPGAEELLQRNPQSAPSKAYSFVRRAAQAADEAYRHELPGPARRAWNDALRSLHAAEQEILLAAAERYGDDRKEED